MHYSNYFFLGLAAVATRASAQCNTTLLQDTAASYLAAQGAGSATGITALDTTTTYTENFKTVDIKTGILSHALKIDHNRTTFDTTACATYTELIITDSTKPYVIGTQIRYTGQAISKVETIVTSTGDWLFNASSTLKWTLTENWGEIPVANRDSRAVLQAAADAYCDIFNNKSVVVPWGTPCDRLEGGSYTGTGSATDSCDVGIPSGVALTNRRYVIDETVGSVDVFNTFAGNLPDSHEFRVQGGKLRYVHTLTVMTGS